MTVVISVFYMDHIALMYNDYMLLSITFICRDFKVTAMNEEELRKSVRRQKFDKSGLAIGSGGSGAGVGNGSTNTTSTGTGTSDTEDEGSTPSAEHADRSLISTLGGSTESIPQTSNSFMQAALPDAPVNIMERGTTGE